MKTLVLFGSPRKNGHTKQMLDILLEHLESLKQEGEDSKHLKNEYKIIDSYKYFHSDNQIKPCLDCRYCWTHSSCSIKDGMRDVYEYLEQCDNIIIATPVYFNGIPAPLKIIIDRFQPYWASVMRKDKPIYVNKIDKKAIILMSGGAKPFQNQFIHASAILERMLQDINTKLVDKVVFPNTDNSKLENSSKVCSQIIEAAKKIIL